MKSNGCHAPALLIPVLLFSLWNNAFAQSSPGHGIRLNKVAFEYARQLIAEQRVVNDKHGAWREHRPSAAQDSNCIRHEGLDQYCRWHLGIDDAHDVNAKARYRFPFGDYQKLHRCALIAAQTRARQYHYADIDNAVTELLSLLESPSSTKQNRRPELVSSH